MTAPLRVIVVGVGAMGRGWLSTVDASPDTELAGVVDLDLAAAEAAAGGLPFASSISALGVEADAVINVSVPEAHYPVTLEAFELGLPVLGEKPLAATLPEAVRLVAAAERAGLLFMVSQSRRYNPQLFALKAGIAELGETGMVVCDFFRDPRFGGFRAVMDHPLLLDMAIHPFDSARYLLDADPVSVYCEEHNPPWSTFRGAAAATAVFQMTGGKRFVYNGSWSSPGAESSWNGVWRVSCSGGSALWDGDNPASVQVAGGATRVLPDDPSAGNGIDGSLAEFVAAVRTGSRPMGEARDNVLSLAMVFAAASSAESGQPVRIADVLNAAADF
ncbi:Gfo/Idh/MocA family protein [Fodinicola acaciae]|uniref:Gfo/Idh/MocA family protein n=1 Tax=Fodinicola acaciae TaxID=2681555 RepID=UPI001C9E6A3F|nr:Gfo/Idh/MocA family oxidoreductase [Fodinicola acaciae]